MPHLGRLELKALGQNFTITPAPTTAEILDERQKTHGEFRNHAAIAQRLKCFMQVDVAHKWVQLSNVQREALEMIQHKVARILNGNPNHKDHWDDIAGYATLVAREL